MQTAPVTAVLTSWHMAAGADKAATPHSGEGCLRASMQSAAGEQCSPQPSAQGHVPRWPGTAASPPACAIPNVMPTMHTQQQLLHGGRVACRQMQALNAEAHLLGAVDTLLASRNHDLAELLGDHVVGDLRRVRGQQLVLLLLLSALDALEAVLVALSRCRRAALVLIVRRLTAFVGCTQGRRLRLDLFPRGVDWTAIVPRTTIRQHIMIGV